MAKKPETKKVAPKKAPASEKEVEKKNPLLDADEDTDVEETEEEDADEETTDEDVSEDSDDSEEDEEAEEEVAPKKAPKAKVTAPAETPKVNVADQAASDIRTTKQILDAEEQVHFMVPLFEGEKPGAVHECFINGHKVAVKKGVMTMVPRSVAELLSEHYKINSEAGADFRLDLNADKQNALG